MIRGIMGLIAFVLCSGIPAPGSAQPTHPFTPPLDWQSEAREYRSAVVRAYVALLEDVRNAWLSADAAQSASHYTEDATLLVDDVGLLQGKGSIEAYLQESLTDLLELRTGLTDFVTSDRMAYGIGPFWLRRRAEDGTVREVAGTYALVAYRVGRTWKIRSHIIRAAPDRGNAGAAEAGEQSLDDPRFTGDHR
jgi:ketosteroid isomerase-like protein